MTYDFLNIQHPYPRYGLAYMLYFRKNPSLDSENIYGHLIATIEHCLGRFRMFTDDIPSVSDKLRFDYKSLSQLKENPTLVQSSGLVDRGIYLAPTIITTDGNAKDTFDNAIKMLKALDSRQMLSTPTELKRSFAATTAKINNGKASQSPPETSLYEAALCIITATTSLKPAAWIGGRNTVVLPDIPDLEQMLEFLDVFARLQNTDGLNESVLVHNNSITTKKPQSKPRVTKKETVTKVKSEFKRPKLFSGNYQDAPSNPEAFGAVGLLAAIGLWARNTQSPEGKRVVVALAGTEERNGHPLYVLSYDMVRQVQFTHHIATLALENNLAGMLTALIHKTIISSELDTTKARWDITAYQLFYQLASRFLQCFSEPTFNDFLSIRAEYSHEIKPLFQEYFMTTQKTSREVVDSVSKLGQWLNHTAYIVANDEYREKNLEPEKQKTKVRQEKAKILAVFESAIMSAKSADDMLFRILTLSGRLFQNDAPAESRHFMDAVAMDDIPLKTAQRLLIAYCRVRTLSENHKPEQSTTNDITNF